MSNKIKIFTYSFSAANCKLRSAAFATTYFCNIEDAGTIAVSNENKFIDISSNEYLQVAYVAMEISTGSIKHSVGESISNGIGEIFITVGAIALVNPLVV